ncbi:hypothetical protein LINGRAPRIM_LOCUS1095 [Linum grandiflorum]
MSSSSVTSVFYTNENARSSAFFALYFEKFRDRLMFPCVVADPCAFSCFDLNPGSLIASLSWGSLVMDRKTLCYPDVVQQFYANLRLDGPSVLCGKFSTYIDGHRVIITPALLARILKLPSFGFSLFCETEFPKVQFNPAYALSCWSGIPLSTADRIEVSALPDALQVLHFFITNVFLPRSDGQFIVTGLDAWIMRNAQLGKPLDYSCLMFSAMVANSNPDLTGQLPFGPEICFLLSSLGIRLHRKYLAESPVEVPDPRKTLVSLGSRRVKVSGGDAPSSVVDLANSLAEDVEFDLVLDEDCLDDSTLVPGPSVGF